MSYVTDTGTYEWKVANGSNTYGIANLSNGQLYDGLFEQFSVGQVVARQLKLTLWNVAITPSLPVVLTLEKTDSITGITTSVPKGTYLIDTYDHSPYSEYADITAYDALLKTEVPYMRTGTWSAKTDAQLVSEIAGDIGVAVDPTTLAYLTANPITIDEAPNIGDNGTTERELLSVIGILRGGNWIINDDNKLCLVLVTGQLYAEAVVTINAQGLFMIKPSTEIASTDYVAAIDSSGRFQSTPYGALTDSTYVWTIGRDGMNYSKTWASVKNVQPVTDIVEIGDEVVEFDISPVETVKRVELWASSSKYYRSPSGLTQTEWEALGGIVVSAQMPIMASQAAADALYSIVNGFSYLPYTAQGVYTDPELALGTTLHIKDSYVVLSQREQSIDLLASCELTAEPNEAQRSYYPYLSPVDREQQAEIDENSARITANEDSIVAEVTRATSEEGRLSSTITQTADGLLVTFSQGIADAEDKAETDLANYSAEVQEYIRFAGAMIELGEKNSAFKAILDNTRLAFTGESGEVVAWLSNNQLYITEAVINGTLTLRNGENGQHRWITYVDENGFEITRYVNG